MDRIEIAGETVMVIEGHVELAGTATVSEIPIITEVRFSDGSRLQNVSCCNVLYPFIESGADATFFFGRGAKSAVLIAVQTADGRMHDVDGLAYDRAISSLRFSGWGYALIGIPTMLILIGFLFIYYGIILLRTGTEFEKMKSLSRILVRKAAEEAERQRLDLPSGMIPSAA